VSELATYILTFLTYTDKNTHKTLKTIILHHRRYRVWFHRWSFFFCVCCLTRVVVLLKVVLCLVVMFLCFDCVFLAAERFQSALCEFYERKTSAIFQPSYVYSWARRVQNGRNKLEIYWFRLGSAKYDRFDRKGIHSASSELEAFRAPQKSCCGRCTGTFSFKLFP